MKKISAALLGAVSIGGLLSFLVTAAHPQETVVHYPYSGAHFTRLVTDSYKANPGTGNAKTFYRWMDAQFRKQGNVFHSSPSLGLNAQLEAEKKRLEAISDTNQRTAAELELAENLHRTIKSIIPKFSLDRGYEFTNVVSRGERQCVLQSALIAGMMQSMGMNAGVDMVWRSIDGSASNNGHAVAILRLSNGKDVLVDCSDPTPFVKQQGLFVFNRKSKQYQFVSPVYAGTPSVIESYKADANGAEVPDADIRPLDYAFLRSQFDFYRGERTPGGLLTPHKQQTKAGMATEAKYLRASIRNNSQNPLSVYMLGRVYLRLGKPSLARPLLTRAYHLYEHFGRVPQGEKDALAELNLLEKSKQSKTKVAVAK